MKCVALGILAECFYVQSELVQPLIGNEKSLVGISKQDPIIDSMLPCIQCHAVLCAGKVQLDYLLG